MSGILQCFYEIFGFVSDKQSGGAVKVVQKQQKIHTEQDQKQEQHPNENQHLLVGSKTFREYGDSIQNDGQTESETKLAPSSDSDYKTSDSPIHTEDANVTPEVPSAVAKQHDEVKTEILFCID